MRNNRCQMLFLCLCFCLSHSLAPVKVVPEAAAYDKEPWVSIPVSEKEERVSALAGSSPESGVVWEWSAQEREWQPQETAGGPAGWGERYFHTTHNAAQIRAARLNKCRNFHSRFCKEVNKERAFIHDFYPSFIVCNVTWWPPFSCRIQYSRQHPPREELCVSWWSWCSWCLMLDQWGKHVTPCMSLRLHSHQIWYVWKLAVLPFIWMDWNAIQRHGVHSLIKCPIAEIQIKVLVTATYPGCTRFWLLEENKWEAPWLTVGITPLM